MSNNNTKNILIAFLDWGLGHATRCMPIIDVLLSQQYKVILAGNGSSLLFMRKQFPQLSYYELASYNITYSDNYNAAWQTLWQSPKIFNAIKQEQQQIKTIVQQEKITHIISDNRYGVYHTSCKNILLTHQIAIQAPNYFKFTESFFLKRMLKLIAKFDELWIPDVANNYCLSGKLSHGINFPVPSYYIGVLSRFSGMTPPLLPENQFKIVAFISGVEPQRTVFEQQLSQQLGMLDIPCLLICGKVETSIDFKQKNNVTLLNYATTPVLYQYLYYADVIICRSGYSTVMDIATLRKKAIFIPTYGQTEQEYIATYLDEKKWAIIQQQSKLQLPSAIDQLNNIKGFEYDYAIHKQIILEQLK